MTQHLKKIVVSNWRKSCEVKDASKRAEPGINGVVIGTKLFEKRSKSASRREKKFNFTKKSTLDKKELKDSRDVKLLDLLKDEISDEIRDVIK